MSEENKTGENLVEQVEQEDVESKKEFNPKAFIDEESKGEEKETEQNTEVEEKKETNEEDDDEFSWGSVETEAKDAELTNEDDDWDSASEDKVEEKKEEVKEAPEFNWESLASDLGVEAKDEKGFKDAISKAMEKPVTPSDTINTLEGFLKMSDRNLVLEDLKASGLSEEDSKDTLVRLEDSGLLKREATQARKQIKTYIASETKKIRDTEQTQKAQAQKENIELRKQLQSYLKEKEDFFGGKINNTEKKELYNYITSGDFAQEVYGNHANVADAAFLWKYKDKIFKMLTGQGMEKGKAAVLDKITNSDIGRKNRHIDTKIKGGFDPVEFMK